MRKWFPSGALTSCWRSQRANQHLCNPVVFWRWLQKTAGDGLGHEMFPKWWKHSCTRTTMLKFARISRDDNFSASCRLIHCKVPFCTMLIVPSVINGDSQTHSDRSWGTESCDDFSVGSQKYKSWPGQGCICSIMTKRKKHMVLSGLFYCFFFFMHEKKIYYLLKIFLLWKYLLCILILSTVQNTEILTLVKMILKNQVLY